jgi:hypothetical protein
MSTATARASGVTRCQMRRKAKDFRPRRRHQDDGAGVCPGIRVPHAHAVAYAEVIWRGCRTAAAGSAVQLVDGWRARRRRARPRRQEGRFGWGEPGGLAAGTGQQDADSGRGQDGE